MSASAYVLRFSRESLEFRPGQWINVGLPPRRDQREYSIYSSPSDDFLEILVKEIPGGLMSPALRLLREGDPVDVDGPHGSFTLAEGGRAASRFLFCATGTGISPFHSMVRAEPELDYFLLHGVRTPSECYDHSAFDPTRTVSCVSGGSAGPLDFPGRLTEWLARNPVDPERCCYLCGNSDMIYETWRILGGYGVQRESIFAEVYF